MKDFYKILGIDTTASQDEIKRAYRKLASQHHPDKGGDTAKFQEIEEAYRVLSDPGQRANYDRGPQGWPDQFGQGGSAPFNFETIFDIFGARFRAPHQQHHNQQRYMQARMSLGLGLHDLMRPGPKTVSVSTPMGNNTIEINVPAGIDDGDTVQYAGLAPGGGDLLITFRIYAHDTWQKQGSNLLTEKSQDIWTLITGGETTVTDLIGTQLTVGIPARTQPGTVLRLRGRGLPQRQGGSGDMLIKIQGYIPQNIDPELLDIISQKRGL